MKKFKLILKGILLWVSAFIILLSICGIDGIVDESYGWLFGTLILNIILILACLCTITEEECKIVSGYNLLNKIFKLDENKLDED